MPLAAKVYDLNRKNLVDFISDCAGESGLELTNEFNKVFNKNDSKELFDWFVGNGYVVSIDECERLLKDKEKLPNFKKNITRSAY